MTNSSNSNIANRTDEKKHGAQYRDNVEHVESQDSLKRFQKSSEEEE